MIKKSWLHVLWTFTCSGISIRISWQSDCL